VKTMLMPTDTGKWHELLSISKCITCCLFPFFSLIDRHIPPFRTPFLSTPGPDFF
jgi:hypothetical protein